jgi:sugar-specific transcriptional regulator TrmB
MKYEEILKEVGLTLWESQTYLALLELGSTTTGPLVKKCNVPQSKIYSVLESLHNRGLVSHIIRGKTKYFQASEPKNILSILKNKEIDVKGILPDLNKLVDKSQNKQKVEVYEGMKAITSFLFEIVDNAEPGEDWLSFATNREEFVEKAKDLWSKIGWLRAERNLNVKIMDNEKYHDYFKNVWSDRWKFIKKIIRFSEYIFPATTIIFRDKIIILNFASEPETAVVITSKDLVKYYREYYMQHWNSAKKPN